jgi:hypothetical protein
MPTNTLKPANIKGTVTQLAKKNVIIKCLHSEEKFPRNNSPRNGCTQRRARNPKAQTSLLSKTILFKKKLILTGLAKTVKTA